MDQRTPQQPHPPVGGWSPTQALPPEAGQGAGRGGPAWGTDGPARQSGGATGSGDPTQGRPSADADGPARGPAGPAPRPGSETAGPGGSVWGPGGETVGPGGSVWGPGGPTPGSMGVGGRVPGPGRGGYWIAAGIIVLLVLSAIGILLGTGALGGSDPDETVEGAVEDLRGWDSVTYRGEILQHGEGNLDVLVTVDREGDMAGTLSRPGGGRAEYARIDGVEMLKADAAWWKDDPRREQKAGRLAGVWLRNAGLETAGMSTSSMVLPGELARDLAVPERGSSSISLYADRGAETVDGVEGRVLESVTDRVVVAGDSPPRLLAFQPSQAGASSMRVSRGDQAALAAVGAARTIRTSAADYSTKLREPAKVALAWDPPNRDCSTPICTVGTRLTNTSSFEARGVLKVRMNGALKGYHPFRLAAGRSATVGTRADNPGKGRPVPMQWVAEVDVY